MGNISIYDCSVHILNSTVEVTGFSEDADAIAFPQDREQTTYRVGALGDVAFFGSPQRRGGLFMIKLLPTSETIKIIQEQVQRARNGHVVNWDATFKNRRTKHSVVMKVGAPTKIPVNPNWGPEVSNLIFEWMYQDLIDEWAGVTTIAAA